MCNIYIFIIAVFIINSKLSALSFNQPKLCPTASWNHNAITFANESIVGYHPVSVFITTNNTIYVFNRKNNTIIVWHDGNNDPTNIPVNFINPYSLFVTSNGDIYIDDGDINLRVQKWIAEKQTFVVVMNVNTSCWDLFVDTNDTLYCSISPHHQIVKRSLNHSDMTSNIVAAGTGSLGSAFNELNVPWGIFVDVNFDLYVADCGNNRVQLFQSGETNGITVAGDGSPNPTISLRCPSRIVLDAEKYLFIVDQFNHRIVGSSLNGFRCLVGCYGQGSQSDELDHPSSLSFDRFGNMFVADAINNRIQKFESLESCYALSFHQPKFCPTASWNRNAITFANKSIVGQTPPSVFVNMNNTIYVANEQNSTIAVWHEGDSNLTNIISGNFTKPHSLFVTSNGDIYIDDGEQNGRVQKWIAETRTFAVVMKVNSSCNSLFVDTNDTLYCSMSQRHQIVKRPLNHSDMMSISVAAGTGSLGSALNELNGPWGIFVDVNFDLYVADCDNNRVQLFQSGESNGTTVAGKGSPNPTISLRYPSGIVLDAEKYLFIVDSNNHRIVGSSLNGFRCLVGCYGKGSQSNRLTYPSSLGFDRSGNMFVADWGNDRIQKFEYLKKSCVYTSLVRQNAYVSSLSTSNQVYSRDCNKQYFYYESIQVKVLESGYYSFRSYSTMDAYSSIYKNTFNPLDPSENLLQAEDDSDADLQVRLNIRLSGGMTYVLVITTYQIKETGEFSIIVLGPNKVILEPLKIADKAVDENVSDGSSTSIFSYWLGTPVNVQWIYSSKLTDDSPTYYRDFQIPKCHFETLEIHVVTSGMYVIWSESSIGNTYGYIYKNDFNALKPSENLLLQHDGSCNGGQFKLFIDLEINTRYMLVVTTHRPNTIGNFSVFISGPSNVTLKLINVGYIKAIGLTLDDILRDELRPNRTLNNQSFSIKISAALTIILFVGGMINSILSLITFQTTECRQVGCGIYLLTSSVTSFLTISMFTVKFWFVVLSQINVSTSLSVLRGGCVSIEVILKFLLYLDGWFNACVAIERAVQVYKGVSFDKKKSKFFARRIIFILPFCIIVTLTHELVYRRLLVYQPEIDKNDGDKTNGGTTERYVSCIARYSPAVQDYNTAILFFHLVGPFLANLCSALFIIFGVARQRSVTQTGQTFREHVREQFNEHKQLMISPVILLILSIPRLVISLFPDRVKVSDNLWLFLSGYFISFIPSILVFIIFVVPSDLYMKAFKQSFKNVRQRTHTRQ